MVTDAIAINTGFRQGRHAKWELAGLANGSSSISSTPFSSDFSNSLAAPYLVEPKYILESFTNQHDFITELYQQPAFRAQFQDRPPDMYDRKDRIKVWTAMYEHQKNIGAYDPLWGTLDQIRIYLQRFTRHSEFDVSDFGEMFIKRDLPMSLSGRVLQDCGVYAMSVASELYAVTKAAQVPDVSFMLYTVPGHVTLVVSQPDSFYVVNNDQVLGPYILSGLSEEDKTAVIFQQIAIVNADGNKLKSWISPVARLDLGTSLKQSQKKFDERAWEKYTDLTTYALKHQESGAHIRDIIMGTDKAWAELHREVGSLVGKPQDNIQRGLSSHGGSMVCSTTLICSPRVKRPYIDPRNSTRTSPAALMCTTPRSRSRRTTWRHRWLTCRTIPRTFAGRAILMQAPNQSRSLSR